MQTMYTTAASGPDGVLNLKVGVGQPNTLFEVVIVVQPKLTADGTPEPAPADPWAAIDAFRERLAASGRTFSDSTELIREDRDR